jgi:hypothetical protein
MLVLYIVTAFCVLWLNLLKFGYDHSSCRCIKKQRTLKERILGHLWVTLLGIIPCLNIAMIVFTLPEVGSVLCGCFNKDPICTRIDHDEVLREPIKSRFHILDI